MTGPGLLVRVGLLLMMLTAAVGTPADADLWGHLTFGRDIITTGHIIQPDPYSFTSDRPWINHEWLAEVTFAEVYRLGGSPGLVGFKVAIIAALFSLLWRHLKSLGAPRTAIAVLLILAFIGTFWRLHTVRPQLFSVLFFAILLMTTVRAERHGQHKALFLLPPLMALWVNLHGGWIVGIGVLGLWTAMRIVDRRMPWRTRLTIALAGLAALGATLINPYGVHLWTFLGETVRLGRDDIEEWGSILTYPLPLGLPWAVTLIAAAVAFWRSKERPRPYDDLAIVALLALASFRVSRLDAFFALAVVILFAVELGSAIAHFTRRFDARVSKGAAVAPSPGFIAITVAAVIAMAVPAIRLIEPSVTCLTIAGAWVPEAEAATFIQRNQLKGRMLTWFDWGQYAIWHFGPGLQVSMDGRRETVYSDATIQAHRRFYAADSTALDYLRSVNPDYVWLPTRLPIADRLAEAGWVAVFSGPVSAVFAQPGDGPFQQVGPASPAMRCFPGP